MIENSRDYSLSAPHFLIVDDDGMLCLVMKMRIWKIFHHVPNIQLYVKTANNGDEALTLLEREGDQTSVVITDLEMPIKNGYELITAIRQRSRLRHLKIIMATGVDYLKDEELANFLLSNPFIYYLRKDNVTPEELKKALCKVFDR